MRAIHITWMGALCGKKTGVDAGLFVCSDPYTYGANDIIDGNG